MAVISIMTEDGRRWDFSAPDEFAALLGGRLVEMCDPATERS